MKTPKYLFKQSIVLVFLSFFLVDTSFAQVDLTLSLNDFKNWAPSASNAANISTVPLAERFMSPNQQITEGLNKEARILYSPDGMDNWGPYVDSSGQFNLFNFTHWQYIDMLAWFGGTASIPVLLPSKPWVDAAHQNGVKVIGCVFFAPQAWGGSEATLSSFLEKDADGNFTAVEQLIELANYYNFDGWFLNFETNVSSSTANLAMEFLADLKNATDMELIWYDAMLTTGTVSWQNKLNVFNSYFFENATGMFTNYWWNGQYVSDSQAHAISLGRSPYDVYTGADMWPDRNNQTAFTDYSWIEDIIANGVAKTSIALYATNFTFNYSPFSNFQNDPSDYANFYASERKIFAGVDEDPFSTDQFWKGVSHYIPVRTASTLLPFSTDFNLGHGLNFYDAGSVLRAGAWHNLSHQAALPSWTFYGNDLDIDYSFDDAYSGGSCLEISAANSGTYQIPLFSTRLVPTTLQVRAEIAVKSNPNTPISSIALEVYSTSSSSPMQATFQPTHSGEWELLMVNSISPAGNDTITAIHLKIEATGGFDLKLGKVVLDGIVFNSVSETESDKSSVSVFPNPSSGEITFSSSNTKEKQLRIFGLDGRLVLEQLLHKPQETIILPSGIYIYEVKSEEGWEQGKLVIK